MARKASVVLTPTARKEKIAELKQAAKDLKLTIRTEAQSIRAVEREYKSTLKSRTKAMATAQKELDKIVATLEGLVTSKAAANGTAQ